MHNAVMWFMKAKCVAGKSSHHKKLI